MRINIWMRRIQVKIRTNERFVRHDLLRISNILEGFDMNPVSGVKAIGVVTLLAIASAFGQSGDFTCSGKVLDGSNNNQPLAMATITYTSTAQRLSFDFSRADGTFGSGTDILPPQKMQNARINLPSSGPVTIDIFDMTGKKISTISRDNVDKGSYLLEPGHANLAKAMYMLKITAGNSTYFQKYLNTGSDVHTPGLSSSSTSAVHLSKALAAVDTVRVGKTGYTPVKVPITTYQDIIGNVTLTAINIENEVTAMYNSLSQAEVVGQCAMPVNTNVTNSNAASLELGSVFGGGGAFSGYTPSSMSSWCSGLQNAMQGTSKKIPMLVVYDGVHGMDVMAGGTLLPHNMGMGAIQDSTIVEKAFRVAALEIRGTGANWTFGPCIAVIRDDRWGRAYEGFAETPDLTSKMARWAILGEQTSDPLKSLGDSSDGQAFCR